MDVRPSLRGPSIGSVSSGLLPALLLVVAVSAASQGTAPPEEPRKMQLADVANWAYNIQDVDTDRQ